MNKGLKLILIALVLVIPIIGIAVFFEQKTSQLTSAPSPSATILGNADQYHSVTEVVDGDTIKVQLGDGVETIRLIGVDTPETKDPRKPVECFGKETSEKTAELVANQEVSLEEDGTQDDRDRYGRLLRYVRLENGKLLNQQLIEEGYAFEYTYEKPYLYQKVFQQAQELARTQGRGLWATNSCNGLR